MEDLSPIEEDVNFKEMYHVFLPQEFRETSASTVPPLMRAQQPPQ